MSDVDEFKSDAAHHVRMAELADDPDQRMRYLLMAQLSLLMALLEKLDDVQRAIESRP